MENGVAHGHRSLLDHHTEANGLEWRRRLPIPLTHFIIPIRPGKGAFYKYAMRSSIDFPLVNFAVSCNDRNEKNGTRVAVGAVASSILSSNVNTLFFVFAGEYMIMFINYMTYYSFKTMINSKDFAQGSLTIMISAIACVIIIPVTSSIALKIYNRN